MRPAADDPEDDYRERRARPGTEEPALDPITCAECGSSMVLRETRKYPYPNGSPRKFWSCSRYPACRATHGAHPDGQPFGIPGDADTRAARSRAHAAFDRLWRSGAMGRRAAYRLMQRLMRMTESEAHIGKFDVAQCEALVERLRANEQELSR